MTTPVNYETNFYFMKYQYYYYYYYRIRYIV